MKTKDLSRRPKRSIKPRARKPQQKKTAKASPIAKPEAPKGFSGAEFAQFCKVSAGTVTGWCDEGMPCERLARMGSKVSINLRDAVPWIVQKKSARSTVERDRVAAAQAHRLEMANLKEEGQLIDAAELKNALLKMISFLAQDLESVAQRITTDETIQAKVNDELRIARNRFADHIGEIAGVAGTAAAVPGSNAQASAPNAGAVGRSDEDSAAGNAGTGAIPKQ